MSPIPTSTSNLPRPTSSIPTTPSKYNSASSIVGGMSSSNNNTGTVSATAAIAAHFEELKRELGAFMAQYQEWLESRRRPLADDKEHFVKSVAEEEEITAALQRQHEQLVELKRKIRVGMRFVDRLDRH